MEKKPKDYTVKDIHIIFMELYERINNEPYPYNNGKTKSPFPFIGNEIKALKRLLDQNNIYEVLCAMYNAIAQNTTYFSVANFVDGFERYKTQHDPELYWKVTISDNAKIKQAWLRYKILKSMWFPKAGHKKELEKLEKKFTKWKNEEEN